MGAIVAAKAELVEALPADGVAVLNGDDKRVADFASRTRAAVVYFGLSEQCHVRASDIRSNGLDGIGYRLITGEGSADVELPLPGKHHVYPALAAAAVALNEGMAVSEVAAALSEVRADLRLTRRSGLNGSTIIDDSYNASPASMLAALDLLSELPGRRIAVLGEMRELGAATSSGNREVGAHAASCCDVLYVVDDQAREIGNAADKAGLKDVRFLRGPAEAIDALQKDLRAGDYVLIKASRAVGLESVAEALVVK
jgi:UDP-N-acetylmuramoyl-tripeptide--D-alanyl-D-alanine ligase